MTTNPDRTSYHRERLRQARWGFNISVVFFGTSAAVAIIALLLLLSGRTSSSVYGAAAGGLASTAIGRCLVKLSSEANDRLDRLMDEDDDTPL
jgi:hypothetical protein